MSECISERRKKWNHQKPGLGSGWVQADVDDRPGAEWPYFQLKLAGPTRNEARHAGAQPLCAMPRTGEGLCGKGCVEKDGVGRGFEVWRGSGVVRQGLCTPSQ